MDTAARHPDPTAVAHSNDWLRVDVGRSADRTATRLVLTGELDRTTAEVLRRSVAEVLRDPAPATLEIDAGRLGFLDSSGIRGLLVCRKSAEAAGSRLLVVDAAPNVYRVLEITGLLDLFATPRTRRQPTRETRRAAAVRDDDALRSLRVPDRPSHG